MVSALGGLSGDLGGKYYPLGGMTDAEQEQLIEVSIPSFLLFSNLKFERILIRGRIIVHSALVK